MANTETIQLILKAQDDMSAKLDNISKKFQQTSKESNNFANQLKSSFAGLLPALSVTAIVAGLNSMVQASRTYADSVDKVQDITGVSAEQASKWVVQAQHVGTSAQTVAQGMALLSKNLETNQKAFNTFGIEIKDTNTGALLPLDTILASVRKKEAELGAGSRATAMEMSLFGQSGKELHDFLSADADEMERVTQRAKELGLILDDKTSTSFEQMGRDLNDFKMIQESLGLKLSQNLLPAIIQLGNIAITASKGIKMLFDLGSIEQTNSQVAKLNEEIQKMTQEQLEFLEQNKNMTAEQKKIFDANNLYIIAKNQERMDLVRKLSGEEIDIAKKTGNGKAHITDEEFKKQQEQAEKLRDIARTTALSSSEFFKKDKIEQLQDTLKYDQKILDSGVGTDDQRRDHAKTVADDIAKLNEAQVELFKTMADAMASNFVDSLATGEFAFNQFASNIAKSVLAKGFYPIQEGLKSALGQFGDLATIVSGGIGGAMGAVVGGFINMLGQQGKSTAQLVEQTFNDLSNRTNEAISKIGKEESFAQKKLSALESLKPAKEGGTLQGELAKILGVEGLKFEEARTKMLNELLSVQKKGLGLLGQDEETVKAELARDEKRLAEINKLINEGKAKEIETGIGGTPQRTAISFEKQRLEIENQARKQYLTEPPEKRLDILKEIVDTQKQIDQQQLDAIKRQQESQEKIEQEKISLTKESFDNEMENRRHLIALNDETQDTAIEQAQSLNKIVSKYKELLTQDQLNRFTEDIFKLTGDIPQFAEGGVVTKPTLAWVGDGGEPEYIIPQSKMDSGMTSINVTFQTLLVDNITTEKAAKIIDQELVKLRRSNRSLAFASNIRNN